MYKQKWYADINNSQRLVTYCGFKHDLTFEEYLDNIYQNKFRIALTQFRVSSHHLRIEKGRYENLPRDERKCIHCRSNMIENEYHFLLICPVYYDLRKQYLKPYYCKWPTINKFNQLLECKNRKTVLNLSKYIYYASKRRQT